MVACAWVHALWCACAVVVAAAAAATCPPCPPCPPPPHGLHCRAAGSATVDECFYHIDNITEDFYYNTASNYFGLTCVEGLTLEEPALPRFPAPVAVPSVTLRGCGPSGALSLATALGRLNVRALDRLLLLQLPCAPLHAHHLAGLGSLRALHVAARDATGCPLTIRSTDAGIFSPLTDLISLKLEGVVLPAAALTNISAQNLSSLELIQCGVQEVPPELCRLPRLTRLLVKDSTLQSLPSACNFTSLTLASPELRRLPALHSVVELTLTVKEAIKLEGCESLKKLTVNVTEVTALPDDWLAQCSQLEELRLKLPNVTALTNRTLTGARALRTLSIESNYRIQELKPGFFQDTRNIETLILSRNNLSAFPIDLFAPLTSLRSLDLSHNSLAPAALAPLSGLPLRRLTLAHNPLGDLCPPTGTIFVGKQRSKLQALPALEELSLQRTAAVRVCSDWRDLSRLTTLDLRDNNITELWWEDLNWRRRDHLTEVRLENNPLEAVTVHQTEYTAASHKDNVMVTFTLHNSDSEGALRCDCHFYWFAKALREGVVGVRFDDLRCDWPAAGGVGAKGETEENLEPYEQSVLFGSVEPADMVCPMDVECPANCTCAVSPAAGGALVQCGRLVALPALGAVARALRPGAQLTVRAPGAGLRALPADLPDAITELDLSSNRLAALDNASAHALFAAARRVRLRGNPLLCACDQPLLIMTRDHQDQVMDLESVTCVDGRSVLTALREGCFASSVWGAWAWGLTGCGLVLLAAGAALCALRRAALLRLKTFLLAHGLCLRWARPDDDGFEYDAFLSYAHADSAVAAELLAALEGDGLRLCVHHRDWRPGDWIPNQIIESVAASRRTVVLLSEAFVRSGWARAEFREAYARALRDGAARLVVVILGDAPPAQLDPEMHHYVTNNTYVRWGEPAFWRKLRAAMPPARPLNRARLTGRRHKPPYARGPAPAAPPTPPDVFPHPPQPPPTPIVKFAQMDFPTPRKPLKQETSPCA